MMTCETVQLLMADHLYDSPEPAGREAFERHLATCEDCAGLYRELTASVGLLRDQQARAATGADSRIDTPTSLDNLWSRLQPQLDRVDAQRYRRLARSGIQQRYRAMLAIAACLMLIVGGLVLNQFTSPQPTVAPPGTSVTRQQNPQVDSFLARVRPALLTLANATPGDIGALPLDRQQAQAMAMEAGTLSGGSENRMSASQQTLLRDVELLLLQYANMEDGDFASGLEVLQLFLDDNYVMFKMQLNELQDQDMVI